MHKWRYYQALLWLRVARLMLLLSGSMQVIVRWVHRQCDKWIEKANKCKDNYAKGGSK